MSDTGRPPADDDAPSDAPPTPLGVRILWFAIGACVLLLIVQVAFALRSSGNGGSVRLEPGELTVSDAIGRSPRQPVTVRGYIFLRRGFPPRLCTNKVDTDPPRCVGPFLDLLHLDESRLQIERGRDGQTPIGWVDEPLAVQGTVVGSSMEVTEILS